VGGTSSTFKSSYPIKFVLKCNLIELYDDINEYLWIDIDIPFDFDYFSTDDAFLEYMGAHFELPKSNSKRNPYYILSQHEYFGKETNFSEVLDT